MTDKEKEAIEYFKKREQICMENADICDENNFDEEATCLRKEHMIIETFLNLIEKKDKRINELEKASKKKDKIIKDMSIRFKRIFEDLELIKQQFKKRHCDLKNIDEKCCWELNKDCSDCIIEYFEKEEA